MPIQSRWQVEIPAQSLPTFLFGSPDALLNDKKPLLINADHPSTHFLTLHTYRLWSKRFAAGLIRAGLQPGDRVLVFSGNSIFFPVVLMGVIMAGGIFCGANPSYVSRELAYQLQDSGARFCLSGEGSLNTALDAAAKAGLSKDSVFVFDDGVATFDGTAQGVGGTKPWTNLIASIDDGVAFKWENLSTPEELDRTIALNYSSGTTGNPKGVMISHKNYVANITQTQYIGQQSPSHQERIKRSASLCFLPMYHAMGQTIFCVAEPLNQVPVYIMPKFDFLKMLEYLQKYKITSLSAVPPIIVALAKHPAVKNFNLSSIEKVGAGAAPLGREVCAELEKLWPDGKVNVKQGWGMTEITCTATTWHPDEISTSFSVGEVVPNCEAKIMADDEVTELPRGQRGEIWFRGPNVAKGYWRKPDATRSTITEDGWLKTGDIAYFDESGKLFIVDRKKELIKVKGNQVAPAELEALLLDHQSIADVAVIGVKVDEDERPRAYIVPKGDQPITESDVHKYMNERVAKIKRLTGGVRFVKVIPKNPSGKILRKILRDQAQKETNSMAKL